MNGKAMNAEIDLSRYQLLHEVFRHRAEDPVQASLMAFPVQSHADYEYFTGKVLDSFTDAAAWYYSDGRLQTADMGSVALLGFTNLDWVVSVFGLSRAGYTILTLSPRLSATAVVKLIQETRCESLIYQDSPQLADVAEEAVSLMKSLQSLPMLPRSQYDIRGQHPVPQFVKELNTTNLRDKTAIIVHSSGSTGLPKPIEISHKKFTIAYDIGPGDRDFMTLPLFHSFAMQVAPARMYQRKMVFLISPNLPMTCEGLTAAIQESRPGTLCAVPFALKLLAEQKSGVDAMKQAGQVMFTGSQCPDDLGDRLVDAGVNLATFLGTSECGFVGSSVGRPVGDNAWNYLRPPPPLMKHIYPKPISPGSFEFVFLENHPGRIVSNSDDPPNSFHSRDIFAPHPSIGGAWKYLGRLDDRITLMNGEKVLPLPIEGTVRQHRLVKEAVVFGVGRDLPGLLLFRSQNARDLKDQEFIDIVWPTIEVANAAAEGFSQIGINMIVPMPADIAIPLTDKGSFIRAQVYTKFEKDIAACYSEAEKGQGGKLVLHGAELEKYLITLGNQLIGRRLSDPNDDLFSLGLNSLQAIQMRAMIIRDLSLGGRELSQNVVFEHGTIANLARHLEQIRSSTVSGQEKPFGLMKDLITSLCDFQQHKSTREIIPPATIVLTGATGALGAHILSLLLHQEDVDKVYCLVRGAHAGARVRQSLQERQLDALGISKLHVIQCELHLPKLGLSQADYDTLLFSKQIVHCAWPVNFQLGLQSFIPSIRGLCNLIQLSLSCRLAQPARLVFCSSVSVAMGSEPSAHIPEAPIQSLEQVSSTGYAASKLVGERIVQNAVENFGAQATIFRIGQVVGDTRAGIWNDAEAFPSIIRSATTMGVLPEINGACRWLPVDILAIAMLEILGLKNGRTNDTPTDDVPLREQLVFNAVSPRAFSWTDELCPALSATGFTFTTIPFHEWMLRLRMLATDTSKLSTADTVYAAADPNWNPAIKLIDFFEKAFSNEDAGSGIEFEITRAVEASPALRNAPDIIQSGLLEKTIEVWSNKWKREEEA